MMKSKLKNIKQEAKEWKKKRNIIIKNSEIIIMEIIIIMETNIINLIIPKATKITTGPIKANIKMSI